jgi:hypothetical protein
MNAYEVISDPSDRAEARDLAALAAEIVSWAGSTNMTIEEALPQAWEFFGQAAGFIISKDPNPAKRRGQS